MEEKTKLTPKEWLENIWYHYKWLIIFGGLLVVFLAISLTQLLSNKDPDVSLLYVDKMYYSDLETDIRTTTASLADDYNEDGKTVVDMLTITINEATDASGDPIHYDFNNTNLQRFNVEITSGDATILILDPEYFGICVEKGLLVKLSDVIDDAYMPKNVINECGVKVSALDAFKLPGFCRVEEDAIICLRRFPKEGEIKYGRTEEEWNGNKKAFVNIIKYKNETKQTEN